MTEKNNTFEEIWNKLKKCKRVAMTLHYSPDGDSLGSCSAMKYVLERDLKCNVTLVSGDSLEENVAELPCAQDVEFGKDFSDMDFKDFDAVLCLDCANSGMVSSKKRGNFTFVDNSKVVQIDHHATNTYYGSMNYVDSSMPSACSVLLEMFKSLNVKFDAELSRRLLVGIYTDSGFFGFDNSAIALKQAAFLIDKGVDYYKDISKPLRFSESIKNKRLFAAIINNLKVNEKGRFAYSYLSLEDAKKLEMNGAELRGGIRAIQDLKDIDFTFTLTETENFIKGSFRSSTNIDVSLFAKALGGGGHRPAAAFQLEKMPLDEAEKIVLEAIERIGIHSY